MMYSDKFVVAVKSNGKVLRETKDLVQLPFGSEFSVLVKNLNSRRAKFTLHIDGQDVLGGSEIIVNANSEVEMKRFIRNGNMTEGNAFKFIERTQAIEDGPRGIKVDDGVVRVEFWFEQEQPEIKTTYHKDVWWNEYRYPFYPTKTTYWTDGPIFGSNGTSSSDLSNVKLGTTPEVRSKGIMRGVGGSSVSSASYSSNATVTDASQTIDRYVTDAGITVPGSKVEQSFTTVYGFKSETISHVIVLRLAGKVGNVEIAAPVTVKSRPKCETCGRTNKHTSKFCAECGTSLELV